MGIFGECIKSNVLLYDSMKHPTLAGLQIPSCKFRNFSGYISFSELSTSRFFNMQSPLQLFVSILCLVSYTLAANLPRIDRQPAPGKAFYTVFPKDSADTSKTTDFVKNIVGAEDLLPWTDLDEKLISWTVEASTDEAAQLRSYADVDSVAEFHPPKAPTENSTPPVATPTVRDTAAVE